MLRWFSVDTRKKKRKRRIDLPLTVPVEPHGCLGSLLLTAIGLITGTLLLQIGMEQMFPPDEFFSFDSDFIRVSNTEILFWVGTITLTPVAVMFLANRYLIFLVCKGRLTLDESGLTLTMGGEHLRMSWGTPIHIEQRHFVRRSDQYYHYYLAWELTQGPTRLVLIRRLWWANITTKGSWVNYKDGVRLAKDGHRVFDVIEQLATNA